MKENIIGIHGGGCIGLGLFADVVSRAHNKYQIIATSNDIFFNQLINREHNLTLLHDPDTTEVSNITMITRDERNVIDLYEKADLLALCLTQRAFNEEANAIALGIIQRYEKTKKPLTILLVMNLPDCLNLVTQTLKEKVSHYILDNAVFVNIFNTIKFVTTVPDRVVTKINREKVLEQIKSDILEKLSLENNVDSNEEFTTVFSEPLTDDNIEKIIDISHRHQVKFRLYLAEKEFRLYVPADLAKQLNDFKSVCFVKNIDQLATIKNKYINGPHTILAWLGGILGCKTIAESFQYQGMKFYIKQLMSEISDILKKNYPALNDEEFYELQTLFFSRCETSYVDPVSRVGRNPFSKLDRLGRVVGSISLRKGFYLSHLPFLEMGIAAGIVYALQNQDDNDTGCNIVKEIFDSNAGSYTALLCHDDGTEHRGLDLKNDQDLIIRIIKNIELLSRNPERFMAMQRFVEMQPRVHHFFSDSFRVKRKIMISFLKRLKINIDFNTGRLSYDQNFSPLSLQFKLIFVRHGETYGNAGLCDDNGQVDLTLSKNHSNRVFQGNVDEAVNQLTTEGKDQAKNIAEAMFNDDIRPDIIFHSPLQRAKQTGMPFIDLLKTNNIPHEYVELTSIREMSFGLWENRRVSDMPLDHVCHQFYEQQHALVKESGVNVHGIFCEAENFCDVILRAYQTLISINEKYAGKEVLMYSHSMFGAACCILMGLGHEIKMQNESYLSFDGAGVMPHCKPVLLNDYQKEAVMQKNA